MIAAGLWPNEQPKWLTLLTSLRSERRILMLSLNSIENELNTTKQALSDLKSEYSQMQSASSEQRKLWDEQRIAYEERKSELEKEKALLLEHKATSERLETQLTESEGSLTSLKTSFEGYQAEAKSQIEALEIGNTLLVIGIIVTGGTAITAIIVAIAK